METTDCSAQDQLDRLYAEKKISQQEYERLRRSLQEDTPSTPRRDRCPLQLLDPDSPMPWQVRLNIGFLAVASLLTLSGIGRRPLVTLAIIVGNGLLAWGLWNRYRWAFCVVQFFCLVSLVLAFRNPNAGVFLNLVFGGILLTAYPYFFEKRKRF